MKRSTYARLLKSGDSFFGPGLTTIHTVYKIEKSGPHGSCDCAIKITTTTGRAMFYSQTERVQLI